MNLNVFVTLPTFFFFAKFHYGICSKSYYDTASPLEKYAVKRSLRLHPAQKQLMDQTLLLPNGGMMGAPEAVQLNMNLMRTIKAKRVLDVGLFTGYSALGAALVIPHDGVVIGIDVTDEYWNATGKQILAQFDLLSKVDVRIVPENAGNVILDQLLANGQNGTYDFCFIDADKSNYPNYYEKCLELLRPGGIVSLDNAFLHGAVVQADQYNSGNRVRIMDELNERIHNDTRVDCSLLPMADGLMLVFKK